MYSLAPPGKTPQTECTNTILNRNAFAVFCLLVLFNVLIHGAGTFLFYCIIITIIITKLRSTKIIKVDPISSKYFYWCVFFETLPAGTKPRTSHHRLPGGERHRKGKRLTIYLQRMTKSHSQSDKHWKHFKGNIGKTSERWVEGTWVFPSTQTLTWSELNFDDVCIPVAQGPSVFHLTWRLDTTLYPLP